MAMDIPNGKEIASARTEVTTVPTIYGSPLKIPPRGSQVCPKIKLKPNVLMLSIDFATSVMKTPVRRRTMKPAQMTRIL